MKSFLRNKWDYMWLLTIIITVGSIGVGIYSSINGDQPNVIFASMICAVFVLPLGMLFGKLSEMRGLQLKLE